MALNMKTLTQALAKTAAVIEKTVQTTVQEVTGPRALQEYDLLDQIGSAGPGLAWKLYAARAARGATLSQQYPVVCVWVLDKRALSESRQRAGLSKAAEDSFLDLIRADAARLVRLRHPGVVHVVQALDENKNAMAMVTEPLFASVANALGNVENVGNVPKELMGMKMGLLEVKHGLLQIAESLDFLHNNARLIHCAISPENVFITSSGAWKLGGFGFAISSDQSTGIMANGPNFHYAEYDVEDSLLPLQPSLNYTAPELARSKSSSAVCSSDIFSFGCLAYHLIAHKQLFDCHNNVKMYMNHLTYLSNEAFSSIPPELVPDLQRMLSANESSRPTALEFTGSPFFRDDTRLRALRFLDHMLARDNMQKSEFLKALSDMWKDFDARVLRYKVLPPLCAELRNLVMQPMILPMVLTIAESQEKNDFDLSTLPALVPVLSTASGDTLLLLVKYAELLISKTSQEQLISHVLPMLVRAYGDNDARIQEEVLRKSASLANRLDAQLVKQAILPRVHGLALRTTVAAVRVNALLCLSELVQKLDKQAVLDILQTIQRCTSVDRSPPTLMCTLGVANSVLKQHGVEFAVEHVLPILAPLLTAQQLNVQQFAKYMLFVKDILRSIEVKRGVAVMDSGIPEIKKSPSADGLQSQALKKAGGLVSSATRSSSSWDEDWGSTAKGQSPAGFSQPSIHTISSSHTFPDTQPLHPTSLQSNSPPISAVSTQQTTSCPPIDVEWPPPDTSSGVNPQFGDSEKPMPHAGAPTSSFDDIDPFANWPPKRGDIANDSGSFGNGTFGLTTNSSGFNPPGLNASSINGSGFGTKNDTAWAFNTENITQQSRQNQGGSTVVTNSGFKMQNSIGSLKQNQGCVGSQADKKMTDIESIFGSNRNDQSAPRLAPPPSTAVGRGRGRGGGNPGITAASVPRPNQVRSTSKQPPLLDLL